VIAADTSTWIAFFDGSRGEDAQLLDRALEDRQVVMVPVVLTELLSDPKLPSDVAETISEVPLIEIALGYWQRVGALRAKVLAKRPKARLGDALIAQSCIDEAGGAAFFRRSCFWFSVAIPKCGLYERIQKMSWRAPSTSMSSSFIHWSTLDFGIDLFHSDSAIVRTSEHTGGVCGAKASLGDEPFGRIQRTVMLNSLSWRTHDLAQ